MTNIHNALDKALLAHKKGCLKEAEEIYRVIIKTAPNDCNALHLLGALCHETGNIKEARKHLNKCIKMAPDFYQALNTRGILEKSIGQIEQADLDFRAALTLAPDFPEILTNLADTCRIRGKIQEAERLNSLAIGLAPTFSAAYNNQGAIERELGNLQMASKAFQTALKLDPDLHDAAINLAITLKKLGQTKLAKKIIKTTIKKSVNYAPAHNCLGLIYFDLGENKRAKNSFAEACRINQNYPEAHSNLGNSLTRLNQIAAAQDHFDIALTLEPSNPDFWSNKAASLQADNRIKDGIDACNKALAINPNHRDSQWNRAIAYLISGNLLDGFAAYETRWHLPEFKNRSFNSQPWKGQNLKNKTILVYSEQGFGDSIQFVRYISLLCAQRPRAVYIETHKALNKLFKSIPMISKIYNKGERLPKSDYHIALMSLPHRFKTTLKTIPKVTPYLATKTKSPYKFATKSDKKISRVGLVWGGRKTHKNDHNRSIAFNLYQPFLKNPNIQFYSLQKGRSKEYNDSSSTVIDLSGYLTDFAITRSILQNLDLVITVDTAMAHLTGSLGIKCWVILPFAPDWRWLLDRNDSPWYPSIQLFRQGEQNKWGDVINQITSALQRLNT
jgi:tetratricopeptide (TPR) repeat protein